MRKGKFSASPSPVVNECARCRDEALYSARVARDLGSAPGVRAFVETARHMHAMTRRKLAQFRERQRAAALAQVARELNLHP
jgi:hypothetical protein